ncbi:hypothetical protein QRX50_25160 [Amycolatopsis carbonis]|uniref:Uncharacterized protein n=1 Tax=Amycolatopsis carbonis TaxID=715471 RepID=A0A9Y2IAE8_9PSEU|nr:hypothetical protein [Amycolatopsis sp. 2-15]WIX74868.1 hypothetical protein QRX50_25160 [Amycolatopsis sp. 2-15]
MAEGEVGVVGAVGVEGVRGFEHRVVAVGGGEATRTVSPAGIIGVACSEVRQGKSADDELHRGRVAQDLVHKGLRL